MKVYPPSQLTLKESRASNNATELESMDVSDETLRVYPEAVLAQYRAVIEQHFENLAPYLALYAQFPYNVTVVRIGRHGTFIGYKPGEEPTVTVIRLEDFEPRIEYVNLFDIQNRLEANLMTFDFSTRTYDRDEAKVEGTRMALADALQFLWIGIDSSTYEKLCIELMEAEGITDEIEIKAPNDISFDTVREVVIEEPAGFRRVEKWAFEFKHHKDNRISANDLHRLETYLSEKAREIDAICLITSGDLTTIGRNIAVENPKLRVWDRDVLNRLVNKHLDVLEKYFAPYPAAIEVLNREFDPANTKRYLEFKQRLQACPFGKEHFDEYESIGTELLQYVFEDKLGNPKVQRTTKDGVQRRDSLFPNLRKSRFFQRVFDRFDADFVIVDFKNYGEPINSDVIEDVSHYANDALGKFVVVVTRNGGGSAAMSAQVRLFRDGKAVVAVSDAHLLEMVARKEQGDEPEDVLSDLLDELLIKY
jgi:Restriction endonuclease